MFSWDFMVSGLAILDNAGEPEGIMLSEVKGERQILHNFNPMWDLKKKQTNKQNKTKLVDTENRSMTAKGKGDWGTSKRGGPSVVWRWVTDSWRWSLCSQDKCRIITLCV